ncbi:MAG: NAD+ synthase [Planctomycetota bacterium]
MRVRLQTMNPTVGAVAANADLIRGAMAASGDADVLVLPELAVCGYPPKDLLGIDGFVRAVERAAEVLVRESPVGPVTVFGSVHRRADGSLANALIAARGGELLGRYEKRLLPTYDVFDEDRYFEPGDEACVIDVGGVGVGLCVCEDLWRGEDAGFGSRYAGLGDPVEQSVRAGAGVVVVASASPFVSGKQGRHLELMRAHAGRHGAWVLGVNQLGGNDDLVFDGHAWGVSPSGEVLGREGWGGSGGNDAGTVTIDTGACAVVDPGASERPRDADDRLIEALTLGVRDYVRKCGFGGVCLGLSGGIDSALTAVLGVRALRERPGDDCVLGISMPGPFSSAGSIGDAQELADKLSIPIISLPIAGGFDGMGGVLDEAFASIGVRTLGEALPDLTQENLQSRVRGALAMAVSNRTGRLVLTTGNKSEIAVGYCTLYGDMNGGLAVLSDVPKTRVYAISRRLNDEHERYGFAVPPIPEATITKPPSAELAPDQLDQDSLPAYEVLDEIVRLHVEEHRTPAEIVEATGFEAGEVGRLCRLIDRNEYKRQQMAVGLKVTSRAFGPGRRMPIARGWADGWEA